ncbi:MAG: alginate lyase family protein [Rhizobiales bacterium]|nr:alginate lyase family protein [Hyphomicrobiales bacterium]
MRHGPVRTGESFRFLSVEATLTAPSDWDNESRSKLWRYNLHYFDWLKEKAASERTAEDGLWIDRWITDNPAGRGTGWEPYPLSLRIVNWIVWFLTIGEATPSRLASLATQVRALENSLEFHLLGNHLFANAKALVFAGSFFRGDEADRWRTQGLALLRDELPEQILPDGGHFELSPMYHALILEDVLDLIGLERTYAEPATGPLAHLRLSDIAARMSRWLQTMCHPDGEISYFNDAAFGIAPPPHEVFECARARGISVELEKTEKTLMPSSGYAAIAVGPFHILFDCGRVGPDYIPGHAHADTLSFELSVGAERLISNSGTSTYAWGADRQRERSTAAHSTVVIDNENSAEVWGSFRVGRRPDVGPISSGDDGDSRWIECHHRGYAHLPGSPIHRRRIAVRTDSVEIVDDIEGSREHHVSGFFHLHPGVQVSANGDGRFELATPEGSRLMMEITGAQTTETFESQFAITFGHTVSRTALAWHWRGELPVRIRTRLELLPQ